MTQATDAILELAIMRLVSDRGPDKTICPSEAARDIGGPSGAEWGKLMPAVRRIAVRLAQNGRIVISRKGKIVDPADFKGVYRLSLARDD